MAITEVVTPLVGVVGTIAGALVGGVVGTRAEKVRARLEQQVDLRRLRLAAYTTFLRAATSASHNLMAVAQLNLDIFAANQASEPTTELEMRLGSLERPNSLMREAIAEIELLAPRDVAAAARALDPILEDYFSATFQI